MNLFKVHARIQGHNGRKFSQACFVRAASAGDAQTIAVASWQDLGAAKVTKVLPIDVEGLWVGA